MQILWCWIFIFYVYLPKYIKIVVLKSLQLIQGVTVLWGTKVTKNILFFKLRNLNYPFLQKCLELFRNRAFLPFGVAIWARIRSTALIRTGIEGTFVSPLGLSPPRAVTSPWTHHCPTALPCRNLEAQPKNHPQNLNQSLQGLEGRAGCWLELESEGPKGRATWGAGEEGSCLCQPLGMKSACVPACSWRSEGWDMPSKGWPYSLVGKNSTEEGELLCSEDLEGLGW